MVEEQTEQESLPSATGSGKEEKKTICSWRYRRDTDWSIQPDGEPITCGRCLRERKRDEVQVGWKLGSVICASVIL